MTLTEYEAMIDADFEKCWAENEWLRSKITLELAKQIYGCGFMDGWDARRSQRIASQREKDLLDRSW